MGTEVKDRKTALDAARGELAGKRRQLEKAEEVRMLRAPAAAKGGARERQALREAEDAVLRIREEISTAEQDVRRREVEHERVLVRGEELDQAAHSKRLKEDKIKVAELGALLRQAQERCISIAKEMAALVLGAERRIPVKLVARRCSRVVEVEILTEGVLGSPGKTTRMGFFAARKEADAGRVRIIPDQKLTLEPDDFEFEQRTPSLPDDLQAVRNIHLGRMFGEVDQREEIDFDRIVTMLEEAENSTAKIAGRKR